LEGRVKAQVRRIGRRVWTAATSEATTPADQAAILGFLSGEWGPGPFQFISADAPVTNLLTPAQSLCDPSLAYGTNMPGGPLLCGDEWAGQSWLDDPANIIWFSRDMNNVTPGQMITASAWIQGEGSRVNVQFYNNEESMGVVSSRQTGIAARATRLSVTTTVPEGATRVRVRCNGGAVQAARPALTLTDQVQPWAIGEGCTAAVIHAGSKEVGLAVPGATYGSVSFTITEVG
jgi:hypothetical protein